MTQKERLVELVADYFIKTRQMPFLSPMAYEIADHLLSNGVVVLWEDDDNLEGIRDYGVGVAPGEMGCN